MQKIVSLYQRNYETDRLVRDEVVPGAEWVIAGEGVATRKYDGTCCLVRDGKLYKRYDAKNGKTPPLGWEPAQEAADPVTGHWPGWLAVGDKPEDKFHNEAILNTMLLAPGTYELLGPKVQGNPEQLSKHFLVLHSGAQKLDNCPRDFNGIKTYLAEHDIEGIVWHHPDGRMAKIKAKDFGLKRATSVAV